MCSAFVVNTQNKINAPTDVLELTTFMKNLGQVEVAEKLEDGTPEQVKKLANELVNLDKLIPGGLSGYITRSKVLLEQSVKGENLREGYYPDIPLTVNLKVGEYNFTEYERIGFSALPKVAFVLVAGGLGERLSYNGIKVSISLNLACGESFFQEYINNILAYQSKIKEKTGSSITIPLIIMTSDDTDSLTRDYLDKNDYFGMLAQQVYIVKQFKVPALVDSSAKFAFEEDGYTILTKPHGHGDVHSLLSTSGILEELNQKGIEYLIFFQDTNGLVFHAVLPTLGVTIKESFDMNTLAVPRVPCDAVGAICSLRKPDGTYLTINTEYNVLGPLLKSCGLGSDKADEKTGYSPYPGNTNVLFIRLNPYLKALNATNGVVPEFVNPKFVDSTRTKFKSPTRLECMMQDLPFLLSSDDKIGCTQLEKWVSFSACKNSISEGINKLRGGLSLDTASSCESDYYSTNAQLLRLASLEKSVTCRIEESGKDPVTGDLQTTSIKNDIIQGLPVRFGAMVSLSPSFAISYDELLTRVISGPIVFLSNSFVHIEGDVVIDGSFFVSGSVKIIAKPGSKIIIKNLIVNNKGSEKYLVDVNDLSIPNDLRIRGYGIRHNEVRTIEAIEGEIVVNDSRYS